MDSYTIWRAIAKNTALTPHEKLIGSILALGFDRKRQRTRLRHETIMELSNLSYSAVSRAVRGLEAKGALERTKTGRSNIYRFCGLDSGRVDRSLVTDQTGQQRPFTWKEIRQIETHGPKGERLIPSLEQSKAGGGSQ